MRRLCLTIGILALSLALLPVPALATEGEPSWDPPCTKADLLVLSAHPDDELLYFGGTIPTYAGERGLAVQVAYMAHGTTDLRQREAKNGLRLCGVQNEPVFLGFRDSYSTSLETAERQWGRDNVTAAIVSLIRQCRPEVMVTHDLNGEYGHGAHRVTSSCTLDAVKLAADETQYPDSAGTYGVWQVKKLYLHLYPENAITMDWRQPLSAFQGKTALDMAQLAYECHVSQLDYHQNVYDTGKYSCAEFGLAFTTVGEDAEKTDFFEHIPPEDLTTYVPPTPAPTASPSPAPTQAAEESVSSPALQAANPVSPAAPATAETAGSSPLLLIAGGALALILILLVILLRRRTRR